PGELDRIALLGGHGYLPWPLRVRVSWLVVLARRAARILISSMAASGFSRITLMNSSFEIFRVSTRASALAVAVRGTSPKMAISPMMSLRPSVLTTIGPAGVGTEI